MNQRIEELYKIIKDANEELKSIREKCGHGTTEECNYAYERPPNIGVAEICSDCGEHIGTIDKNK